MCRPYVEGARAANGLQQPSHTAGFCRSPNRTAQFESTTFDASLAVLPGVIRRGVLEQFCRADASLTESAAEVRVSLTGIKTHIDVLEQPDLVMTAARPRSIDRNPQDPQHAGKLNRRRFATLTTLSDSAPTDHR